MKKIYIFLLVSLISGYCFSAITVTITNPTGNKDTICQGLNKTITTNITGNSGPVTYQWKKNSQVLSPTGSSYVYNAQIAGYDTIIVTAISGSQSSSDTVIFVVKPKPVASFTITGNNLCSGNNVTFSNTSLPSSGSSADWRLTGSSNLQSNSWNPPAVTFNLIGISTQSYSDTLIVTYNGCKDTATNTVVVKPKPNPQFLLPFKDKLCKGSCITNDIIPTQGSTYSWSSGSGSVTITNENPPVNSKAKFCCLLTGNSGQKDITVIETNTFGCTNTNDTTIDVVYLPVPDFTFTPSTAQCSGVPITFDTIHSTSKTISTVIDWKFGDNKTGTGSTIIHIYDTIGNNTITLYPKLIFTSQYGCKDSITKPIQVKQRPDAGLKSDNPGNSLFENYPNSFNPTLFKKCNIVPPHFLQLTNLSTTSSTNTNYYIKWGNGNTYTSSGSNFGIPNINYSTLGAYILTDSVKGGNNCISVKKFNVYIGSSPSNITITNIGNVTDECAPQTYPFKITFDPNDTPGTLYIISTNDGTISDTLINPLSSNPDTIYHTFTTSSCGFLAPNYMNSFFIRVNAKNFCGLVGKTSTIEPITLNSSPQSSFTGPQNGCKGQALFYNSNSIIGSVVDPNTLFCDSTSIKYYWQIVPDTGWILNSGIMGNSINYTGSQNTSYVFNSPGLYQLRLKTGNANLSICPGDSIFKKDICISPLPIASFTKNKTYFCLTDTVKFTNTTDTSQYCNTPFYSWNISCSNSACDGSYCTNGYTYVNNTTLHSKHPNIKFTQPGIYNIALTVNNGCGIHTSVTQTITVKTKPFITYTVPTSVCTNGNICPANINVTNCYATNALTYSWTSSNGTFTSPAALNPGCLTATATNSQTVTLEATNECGTSSVQKTINISPIPIITQKPDIEVCPGQTITIGSFTSNPSGATYTWTNTNTIIGKPASGSGIITSWVAPANNTGSNISATFTVIPTIGSCIGSPMIFTVTIKPKPVNNTLSDVFVCPQSIVPSQIFTSIPAGASFAWTNNNIAIGIGSNGSGSINSWTSPNNTGTTNISGIIMVTPTLNSCTGTASSYTINIYPKPIVNPKTNINVCSGDIINIGNFSSLPAGASFTWTNNNTNIGLGASGNGNIANWNAPINNTGANISGTITVTPTLNNCTGTSTSFIITIKPKPLVDTITPQTICSGQSTQTVVFGSNLSGTSYSWNSSVIGSVTPNPGSGTTSSIIGTTFINNNSTVSTITYTVTPTANLCPGNQRSFNIIVNPAPIITTQPVSSIVCVNGIPSQLAVAFANGTGAASYQWYSNSSSSTTGATAISGQTSATYSPPATITGTTYYYCVITFASSGGCPSITSNIVSVTVNPDPTISSQPTLSQQICEGGNANALIVNYSGGTGNVTYQWYSNTSATNTGGSIIASATSASYIPPTFSTVGNYYYYATVTLNGSGCDAITSNTGLVTVVLDPIITSQPIASQSLCQNVAANALSVVVSGGVGTSNYQWYSNTTASSSGGIAIGTATNASYSPPTNVVGTNYYYCVVTQTGSGCSVTSAVSEIIVNQAPSFTTQPVSSTVCVDGIPTQLAVAFANGTGTASYQWYSNSSSSTTGATTISGQTSATYSPPATVTGTTYYYCVITFASSGGCPSITSNIVSVVVNPDPTISSQPTLSQQICEGGNANALIVNYSGGTGNVTYQWYSNTSATNTGGSIIASATSASYIPPTFSTVGNYYYYAIVTLGGSGCDATTSNIGLVTVVLDPIITSQPIANQSLCQNVATNALSVVVSGGVGTSNYQWYSNTSASSSGGTAIGSATNASYTPPTNVVGTKYYYCVVTQTGSGCSVSSAVAEIIVNQAPSFTTQPTSSIVCVDGIPTQLAVAFSNGTGAASYQWYSNSSSSTTGATAISGQTAATYSPPATAAGTTYYYCVITFASSGGCPSITSNIVSVVVNPDPTISSQPTLSQQICEGGNANALIVNYSGGTGNVTYQWYSNTSATNTGGIIIASATSASYIPPTFSTVGNYYYYATVTLGGSGCDATTSNTGLVTVVPDPTIDSQPIASQSLCQNVAANALSVVVSGGVGTSNYQWYSNNTSSSSGGIAIGSATNASYTPLTNVVGTNYYYCVVTQTGSGCSVSSAVAEIIVSQAPSFTTQPYTSDTCEGFTFSPISVSYTNGTGAASYQWYSNSLSSTTGATAISGQTSATYTPPAITPGITYYYCIISFASSGGCPSITSTIAEKNLHPKPTATYTFNPLSGGHPLQVNFNNTSILNNSNQWIFGNNFPDLFIANPTISLTNTGIIDSIYNVNLIVSSSAGCKDTVTHAITVHPLPIPNFSASNVCKGDTTYFIDSSINTIGVINKWHWNFGNGDTSNIQNPHYLFATANSYSVTLTITNNLNISNQITKIITVHPLPIPDFTTTFDTLGCVTPYGNIFTNTSTGASYNNWSFGDGSFSTTTSPTHIYSDTGYYWVRLIDTTQYGCVDSVKHRIHIIRPPDPLFSLSVSDSCGPLPVTFTNYTTGLYLSYLWDFNLGNPSTSTLPGPFTKIYPTGINDSVFYVSLKATNSCGTRYYYDTIITFPKPKIFFTGILPDYVCSNKLVAIIDSLRGNPDTLKVYFGDTSQMKMFIFSYPFVNNLPFSHVYHYEGNNADTTYILKFIAINSCGSDTVTDTIRVRTSALRVMFERDTMNLCINNPVHFTNKSLGGAFMYKWNFGDGSPLSYDVNPTHTFTTSGQFTVTLIGYNICLNDTLTDTIHSDVITIHPNPKPNFTFIDYPCSRIENAIFIRDPIACANGSNFQWIFGDGSLPNPYITNINPVLHTYQSSGNFNVTLRMTNAYNCISDTTKTIDVLYTPKPNFKIIDSVGCHPMQSNIINFTDTIPACSHFWDLGNGNTSSFFQPFPQLYTNTNSILCVDTPYFITLWSSYLSTIPMGIKTCEDSLTKPLIVHPKPVANFSASDSCSFTYPILVNFISNSHCASNYQWLVNGNPFSNNNNSSYQFNNQGNYIISLINSNQYPSDQCFDTADFRYFIYPHWEDSIQISPVSGCDPLNVSFNLNDTNMIYKTLFGDGQSSVLTQIMHTYHNYLSNITIDYYTIRINVDGKQGCKDSVEFIDTIQVYPRAKAAFKYVHESYPYPDLWRVVFTDLSENTNLWTWNFGDNSTSNLQNPIHSYPRKDSYITILSANNQFNCPHDTMLTIELHDLWGMQIPNAFQPGNFNYDVGHFKAYGEGLLEFRLEVYDTWGNKLWETTEITDKKPTGAWDGTKDGKPMPADTYVWKAYAKFLNGSYWIGMRQGDGSHKTYGTITLMR